MMKLSTNGRYGTRILVYLTLNNNGKAARRHEIAAAEDISANYVEQILMKLKAAGLTKSHRGAKGGYSLARAANSITVADVIKATEGAIALVPCLGESCTRAAICATRPMWQKANDALMSVLAGTTIAEMAEQARNLDGSKSLTFEI